MALIQAQDVYAPEAMAVSADGLATSAALGVMRRGGSAVDAAIAANAVLTVTLQNQCGLGSDLFALVHRPGKEPRVLAGAGRAGSGANADALRHAGFESMPPGDINRVTVPGCVDGWVALHREYGRLSFGDLLAAAIHYARDGFPATPFLARTISGRDAVTAQLVGTDGTVLPGQRLRRPMTAQILDDIADGGRYAFYLGRFGHALQELGDGLFTTPDLEANQAEWMRPLTSDVFGARVWTTPPPTSGYLTLAAAWLADRLNLPAEPSDGAWPHLLIEAMRQAAFDRPEVLFDGAAGSALISPARFSPRLSEIRRDHSAELADSYRQGGTTFVTVIDRDRTAISLIQSNCMSFGSGLVAPGTGIWLQNRGTGFTLRPGHPNELSPGRRPAHTLSPVIVTDEANALRACLGTRGGAHNRSWCCSYWLESCWRVRLLRTRWQPPGGSCGGCRTIPRSGHGPLVDRFACQSKRTPTHRGFRP